MTNFSFNYEMFNKLLGDFINGALSAHTAKIKNQNVSLMIFKNAMNITELELYKFALFQYGIPVIIKCGIVKNVDVVIPWVTFQSDPVKISIDDIYILASFPGDDPKSFVSDQDIFDIREHQLAAHYQFSKNFKNILKQISTKTLEEIAQRFLHCFSLTIKNLHIRIEIPAGKKCHSLGIIASDISITTPNPSKGVPPVIKKEILLNNFSIYLDLEQDTLHYQSNEMFSSIMNALSDNNHQFLLDPSTITAKISTVTNDDNSKIDIICDLGDLTLSISNNQLPVISTMAINAKKFSQYIFIKTTENPTNMPINKNLRNNDDNIGSLNTENNEGNNIENIDENSDEIDIEGNNLWLYFHKLSKKVNDSKLDSFLDRLLFKNKYIKEWNELKKKSQRTQSIIDMDHNLDYQAVIYFRELADTIKSNIFNEKIDLDKILRFANYDPLILIPSFASRFTIFASTTSLKIKYLYSDNDLICETILSGASFYYSQQKLHIDLTSFNILFGERNNQESILNSLLSEKNSFSIDVEFKTLKSGSIIVTAEPTALNVDLTKILSFVSKLDLAMMNNSLDKLKHNKTRYQLDMKMRNLRLISYYKNEVCFDFVFGLLSIYQDEKNINNFLYDLQNISLSTKDHQILNNLSFSASSHHGNIEISLPVFSITLMKNDIELFDEIKNFIKSAAVLSDKAPVRLKYGKFDILGIAVNSDIIKEPLNIYNFEILYTEVEDQAITKILINNFNLREIRANHLSFNLIKFNDNIQSTFTLESLFIPGIQMKNQIPLVTGDFDNSSKTYQIHNNIDDITITNFDCFRDLIDFNSCIELKEKLNIPNMQFSLKINSSTFTITYLDFLIYVNFECAFLLDPIAFSLLIPNLELNYRNTKYLSLNSFGISYSINSGINLTTNHIKLNLNDKVLDLINNINTCLNFDMGFNDFSLKNIPKLNFNVNLITLKFFKIEGKSDLKVLLSKFNVILKKNNTLTANSNLSANLEKVGIIIEPTNITLHLNVYKNDITADVQFTDSLRISFSPNALKIIENPKHLFLVNQIGSDLFLMIDNQLISIPDNSSYMSSSYPSNPIISIAFGNHKDTNFDLSKLHSEQSVPFHVESALILIWQQDCSIYFSSPLEIVNSTGVSFKLLDDCYNNFILCNNQNIFVSPDFAQYLTQTSFRIVDEKTSFCVKFSKKPFTINSPNHNFRVFVSRNPLTFVARVTMSSPVFLYSYFPEPLNIELKNGKTFILYPNTKISIDDTDVNCKSLSMFISSTKYFAKSLVKISTIKKQSSIKLVDLRNITRYLRCRISKDEGSIITVYLSAPVCLINYLMMEVGFSIDNNVAEIWRPRTIPNMFPEFKEFPQFRYYPFPYCRFKDDEFSVYICCPISLKYTKERCGVSRIDSTELAKVPTSSSNDKIMPVTFQVVHDESDTAIVYLKPYIFIHNNTKKIIKLDGTHINPNCYLMVRSIDPSLDVQFEIEAHIIQANLENISTFHMTGPSIRHRINFEVSFINDIKILTISTLNSLGLFAFINDTDNNFVINQAGLPELQYFVLDYSTLLFDLTDTRTKCEIEIKSMNISQFSIRLDRVMDAKPVPNTTLFSLVEIVGKDRYAVRIIDSIPKNIVNTLSNLVITIPKTSLKIIGFNYNEYCRVTLGSFIFNYRLQQMKETYEIAIESIQVDDMNSFTINPVVLLSTGKSFLNFALSKPIGSSYFEYVICQVMPFAAEIDVSYIIDMISLFNGINLTFPQSHSLEFKCLQFKVLPIVLDLSLFSGTPRQAHRFSKNESIPKYLSVIPSIGNFQFTISPLDATDIHCTLKELMLILVDTAKLSFSTQWLRLLGSAAIIGNPQLLVRNFSSAFKAPAKKIPGELFKGTIGSILKTGETTLKGLSTTVRSMTHDNTQYIADNKTPMDGFMWGIKSFMTGISNAATGVVRKPIEKGKEKGFVGAIAGAGEGIAGIFTNSFGGAVDLGAGIISGVRRSIFKEIAQKRVEEPIPRKLGPEVNLIYSQNIADIYETAVIAEDSIILINSIQWIDLEKNQIIIGYQNFETHNDQLITLTFSSIKKAEKFENILNLQVIRQNVSNSFIIPLENTK
ncbi:hypothetical protein TRFO_36452 [Tritrichomonas foetus]|uniref:Chorein N-terminal domain-containing protein n=1 Tax=Tritrichomonas foetus TaxID=1144522 RepID=A0A1J4JJD8_9EUKA|nr:hypothetical protein TRFO_36452 [Tritrichomonas foetus]|eukprot:OHS97356.1 hypothetical protein TRFO_36452 [Tritrichomonas foetus]